MSSPILVTGGTGTLGGHVIPLLHAAGHDVRVLTRTAREGGAQTAYVAGDLETGRGVEAAVAGVGGILHLAGSAKRDDVKARNLVRAVQNAGHRPHVTYVSVVGADRVPVRNALDRWMFGYIAAKRSAEVQLADSGLPWTTLRATQFHDLLFTTLQGLSRMPFVPVLKGVRFQPVEAAEVAARLVELALDSPQGLVEDFGGPEVHTMEHLSRTFLAATGRRRRLLGMTQPGGAAAAFRDGANLTPAHAVGHRTWEEFLTRRTVAAA